MAAGLDVEELLIMWDFDLIIRYIPRFHNELADALATLASMLPYSGNVHIDPLEIQIRERHGYYNTIEMDPDIQPWYHDIKRFLKIKEYPEQASGDQKRTMRRLASSFFLSGDVLYKRTPDLNLLRCVDSQEVEQTMNEVHSGPLDEEVCEQFKIAHRNSTPYRPNANDTVEAANKNIKKILRKMIHSSRQWHETLPFALLGYRTTVHTSVGVTPYLLVYGTKAIIPAKIEIPSLRIIIEAKIEDDEWVKTRLEQLTMIDEKQMAAVCHGQLYQQRMDRAYNKKVWPRKFEVGQLVLRRILPHHEEAKGNFAPNWKGPYIIRRVLPKGALYLGDIEGNDTETAVSADAVKMYFV
ncbi:uncharacterized protein [Nicotiana tomentosiformis]|uniref:uncharacterized protein n=1 Tax=Nicotiana tomentosiformis TaxID=4098 RepID=UPI00388CD63B